MKVFGRYRKFPVIGLVILIEYAAVGDILGPGFIGRIEK